MANPFALTGQSTAGQFVSSGFGGSPVSISKDWDHRDTILRGFEVNPVAFGCMDRTCAMVAGIPWRFEEKIQGEWQPVDDAEEMAVLLRPNGKMSLMGLHWFAVESLMGGGNVLFKKVRIGRRLAELWPMNLVGAEPRVRTGEWIHSYYVYEDGKRKTEPAEDIIHIMRGMSTLKPFWGRSPMISAMTTVVMVNEQIKWNANLPSNMAVPFGAFVDPNLMSQAQVTEAKQKVKERLAGVDHAREPLVLSGGAKWERMGMTPAEMDWIKSQTFSMNLVCAALGWLPVIFSGQQMTYNNLQTAFRYAWRSGAVPYLRMLREAYNNDADLVPQQWVGRRRFTFDLSDEAEMLSDMMDRFTSHERAVRSGVNVADSLQAHRIPVPVRPEYDHSYLPSNYVQRDAKP